MADNSKFLAGIVVGAAAGAAIALLLSSENGRQVFTDIKTTAEKFLRDWKHNQPSAEGEETAV